MKKVIPFLILLVLFFLALSPALFRPKPGAGESWLPRFTLRPPVSAPYRNSRLSPERRTEDLLSRMTLEEKAAQLLCPEGEPVEAFFSRDGRLLTGNLSVRYPGGVGFAAGIGRIHGGLGPEQTAACTERLIAWSRTETRLGIPVMILEEGRAGSASPGSTRFPSPLGQAAAWNRELVETLWSAAAAEDRSRGITLMALPGPEQYGGGTLGLELAEAARRGVSEIPGILAVPGEVPFTVSEREGILALYRSTGLRTRGVLCAVERNITVDRGETLAYRDLPALVRSGELEEATLDSLVRPVLLLKFRLGLFDDRDDKKDSATLLVGSPDHSRKAREGAESAFVLLENRKEILPLVREHLWTMAVIGPGADRDCREAARDRPAYHVTALKGIRDYSRGQYDVIYAEGCRPEASPEDWELLERAESAAARSDVVVLILWANNSDGTVGGRQEQLLENVADRGTPLILVILGERIPVIPRQAERARAVITGFSPGQETGRALARLLFGTAEFRGRLPVPAGTYPAGYGLAATTFRWSHIRHENGLLTVDITNTGTRRGTETVQLYISRRSVGSDWPERELADFTQTTLEPGETRTVTFFTGRYEEMIPADGDLTLIPARNSAENLYRIPLNTPPKR